MNSFAELGRENRSRNSVAKFTREIQSRTSNTPRWVSSGVSSAMQMKAGTVAEVLASRTGVSPVVQQLSASASVT